MRGDGQLLRWAKRKAISGDEDATSNSDFGSDGQGWRHGERGCRLGRARASMSPPRQTRLRQLCMHSERQRQRSIGKLFLLAVVGVQLDQPPVVIHYGSIVSASRPWASRDLVLKCLSSNDCYPKCAMFPM
jgi:hypothetical protein